MLNSMFCQNLYANGVWKVPEGAAFTQGALDDYCLVASRSNIIPLAKVSLCRVNPRAQSVKAALGTDYFQSLMQL